MRQDALNLKLAWMAAAVLLCGAAFAWADPVSGHCLHAASLALGATWLIHAVLTGAGATHRLMAALLLAAMWGAVQMAAGATVSQFATANAVTAWLARAALFQLAYSNLGNREMRDRVLSMLLYGGFSLAVLAILQWFTGGGQVFWLIPTQYTDQIMGTFLNRDHYAVFVELLLPIALIRALTGSGPRLLPMSIAATLYASVIACGARAGTVVVTLETAIICVVALRRSAAGYKLVLTLAAFMAISLGVAGWEFLWLRLADPHPFAIRREMLIATMAMIRTHPLTGFGLGSWPAVYPRFAVFDPPGIFMNHAHNDWAEWIADGGILFGSLSLWAAAEACRFVTRNWWALGIPGVLLHSLVDFPMQKPALAGLLFFLLGAAAAT
ncbi:MAG TPA: O-antigen ligase family protein, partial [Bryobacteraceae bacterium]|nr:O-antigen ligase family protein [Bryobacteraceae bacterium]